MLPLTIAATKSTPKIHFDAARRHLEISGVSYPENSAEFFGPVLQWLEAYLAQLLREQKTTVTCEITYFNSSSSKVLLDLFDHLDHAVGRGNPVVVYWRFRQEDDTAKEAGEEFQEDLDNIEFVLVPITS